MAKTVLKLLTILLALVLFLNILGIPAFAEVESTESGDTDNSRELPWYNVIHIYYTGDREDAAIPSYPVNTDNPRGEIGNIRKNLFFNGNQYTYVRYEIDEGNLIISLIYNRELPEPKATEPEVTEPKVTEPEVTEPKATEPEVTEPKATEPKVTEPEVTEPKVTEPKATEPKATEPEVTEPEVTEPEITEPEVTEPEITESQVTEPEQTTPNPAAPEIVNPEAENSLVEIPDEEVPLAEQPKKDYFIVLYGALAVLLVISFTVFGVKKLKK